MQTIPQATPTRKPRGKNVYRARQTERPGWRPRRRSPQALARDIADSIQSRIAEGRAWSFDDYGIADNPQLLALVRERLVDAAAPAVADTSKARFDTSSHEWTALAKLDGAAYTANVADEVAAHRQAFLRECAPVEPTVITEYHDEGYVILYEDDMNMLQAEDLIERLKRPRKTKFVIFQVDRTVALYR